MTSSLQPREEVFPGYRLSERIGSGGYAEVWRASAPGEIEKAVKIVYGCYDEHLAVQELKALERIKNVRHPFVLSLERFEIVDGRLAILTELADLSLEQRAQQCRAQGLPGIPRDELLRYLSDTAEALDFLADRHSLQHLDIKPANLLIVGDHVKVADFGLVKELASRTQNSMVAGMTPTYSSPEMFDDAPSPHSDQYSLAIVYQEMLTGALPFPGRTTAQLANQHLHTQPQLASLSESDRPIVARALAKNPNDRFPSCRSFLQSLREADRPAHAHAPVSNTALGVGTIDGRTSHLAPKQAASAERSASHIDVPDTSRSHEATLARQHSVVETKSEANDGARARLHEEIVDIEVPQPDLEVGSTPPTLYIAAGGIGIRTLCRLREALARRASLSNPSAPVEMIAVDTDRSEIKNACATSWCHPLGPADVLHAPLKLPQVYREQGDPLDWISHRWLYNIPRSLETRGYRPLGRLAVVDHADKVLDLIDRKLRQITPDRSATPQQDSPAKIRVVLVAGMGGGTGGGMVIDLANAVRSRMQALGCGGQIEGVLICTCLDNVGASPLSIANTYALLAEVQFVSKFGNQGIHATSGKRQLFESPGCPFDFVYAVRSNTAAKHSIDEAIALVAAQLALAATDGVFQVLQAARRVPSPRELAGSDSLLLRSFGSAPLMGMQQERIAHVAKSLAQAVKQEWMSAASPSEWRRLEQSCTISGDNAHSPAGTDINAATTASSTTLERWHKRFERFASTRFAFEALLRIAGATGVSECRREANVSSASPERFIEQAVAAAAFMSNSSLHSAHQLSEDDASVVEKLAEHSRDLLTMALDEIDTASTGSPFAPASVEHKIAKECTALVEQFLGKSSPVATAGASPITKQAAHEALEKSAVDLLQCGYDRRTMLIAPADTPARDEIANLIHARPTARTVAADVDAPVVFCECAGISATSLARGMERVYPGIADAAKRLFTRIDFEWSRPTDGPSRPAVAHAMLAETTG